MTGPLVQTIQTSETPAQTTVEPTSAMVWTTLAMQVRIQIVKNLEYLACLEITKKTNQEQSLMLEYPRSVKQKKV